MSLQKKNVIQEFIKEDHVPTPDQFLVKYISGRGNNLHEVECVDGNIILVSMPKKYRHTVWLKKSDCLVIDPIEEGKKVKGEIVCFLPFDSACDLIKSAQWPKPESKIPLSQEALLQFFSGNSRKQDRDEFDVYPSSESSDVETEEEAGEDNDSGAEEDEEKGDQLDEENEAKPESEQKISHTNHERSSTECDNNSENVDDLARDRNRSRVQLVTSGVVTVTNVLTEGLSNDIQSLEFEADEEESSDEPENTGRDVQRKANTIRIQVNYNANNHTENEN